MKVIDSGHLYNLDVFDGSGQEVLTFMKREGPGYPFNVGSHPGTNCQEVLRALIDRVKYLDNQIPCPDNKIILNSLRTALIAFEHRAARRHGRELEITGQSAEHWPTCSVCGHVGCPGDCR